MVYNAILRRYEDFIKPFGTNTYATTIHVLSSAIQKISRAMRIPDGLPLYRGFSGKSLPQSFHTADGSGALGFAEWGFMSTTADINVAIEYSGTSKGKHNAMVFAMRSGAVDRGACVEELSQYHGEREILWPPLSFVAPSGRQYVEQTEHGLIQMMPLSINANLKTLTVEGLLNQKKDAHLASFRIIQDELGSDLAVLAAEHRADLRMQRDKEPDYLGVPYSVEDLLDRIKRECLAVYERHRSLTCEAYAENEAFRFLVTEMLETKTFARSKLLAWLEDESITAGYMIGGKGSHGARKPANVARPHTTASAVRPHTDWCWFSLRVVHRWRVAYWERFAEQARPPVAVLVRPHRTESCVRPLTADYAPSSAALRVCRMRGLVHTTVAERSAEGESVLVQALSDGAGGRTLDLLISAGGDASAYSEVGPGFLSMGFADQGDCEAVGWLCRSGADLERRDRMGKTMLIRAAGEGRTAAVRLLLDARADVLAEDANGTTALMFAARWGFEDTAALLLARGAALANGAGRTALDEAAARGRAGVVVLLKRAEAGRGPHGGREGEPQLRALHTHARTRARACM